MNRESRIKLFILASCFLLFVSIQTAHAQTVTLSGHAWSDIHQDPTPGAGWIQFKGQAQNGANYGVVVNTANGNMTGQAWSENYGWLSFDVDPLGTLGCPAAPCQANVNLSTGVVTGWARFTAGPPGTSGVWNGWVELKGTATDGAAFGVTYNSATREFSGEAWGENDIGWVRFKGTATNGNPYVVKADADIIPQTATINVTVSPASPASGTWSIAPGGITGTGAGTRTVTPASGGTSYTITPGTAPAGYDPVPTITSTPTDTGSSFLLAPNETKGFVITYNPTPPAFDYSLNTPADVTVRKAGIAQQGQNAITATWVSGSGTMTLSASGLPSGVSAGFSGQGCAPTSGNPCNSTATYTVQPSAPIGDYTITINALSPSHNKTFVLHILPALNLIVTCSASPTLAKVGDNVTWSVSVDNAAAGGPYTYAWSGSSIPASYATPDPDRNSFVMQYTTTGVKNATATVWDVLNNQAQCAQAFINIGVNPGFGEF